MKKKILIVTIGLVMVIALGYSFAYLRTEKESQNNTSIKVSEFHVDLITDIDDITLDKVYPVKDAEGLTNTKALFAIKNNGPIIASYKVSLVDKNVKSTVKNQDIRYQLKRTIGSEESETFDITNLSSDGLIDSGTIESGVTISYELICWIDFNSNPNNAVFAKAISVEGTQISSLDKSGANFPELLDNMIPVYYEKTSDTEGVWKKGDSLNSNSTYKWFDYDEKMWANAVTVYENSELTELTLNDGTTVSCSGATCTRDDYLNADVGTVIPLSDITSMWVWVPRYKYTVFNGNNGVTPIQQINIMFEHGIGKTGTVSCSDNILKTTSSNSSQNCTDETNNGIVNGISTYTHPAFTFGDEELTGFWISKFESSTDDANCSSTVNATNCNKNTLNILSKPLNKSLRYISIYNMFMNTRNMELYNNIHGFTQSDGATATDNTGEIAGDSNNFDIHMIKNMEWGAVAYLSQSKYGKYDNSLYTTTYKEVYVNNNSGYLTGYSGGAYNSSSSATATYAYNDLTDQGSGKGYRGAGASSTGNIYGVYDMSGGVSEYVMGNIVNSSGLFNICIATTWTTTVNPSEKYYDKYSYNSSTSSYTVTSGSRGKLGDATKEVVASWASSGRWNGDYNYYPYGTSYGWMARGGYVSNTTNAGVFANNNQINGGSNQYYGSRSILSISRDMPWLNN